MISPIALSASAFEEPDVTCQVFQFPACAIPRIDGEASGGPLIDKGHKDSWNAARVVEVAAMPADRISVD